MDQKKMDDIVKKITVMLLGGKTHHRVMTLLQEEGHTLDEIKQSIPFLRVEDTKQFSEYFKKKSEPPLDAKTIKHVDGDAEKDFKELDKVTKEEKKTLKELEETAEHEKEDVEKLEKKLMPRRGTSTYVNKVFLFAVFITVLVFIFWLQITTSANLLLILLGFSPFLMTVIITMVLVESQGFDHAPIMWPVGISLVVAFYFVAGNVDGEALRQLDIGQLTALNSIGIIAFLAIISLTWSRSRILTRSRREKASWSSMAKGEVTEEKWHVAGSMPFRETVQSLEDKCKAINFVIGRIYGERHGGTKQMREKLRIPSEFYNQFSAITNFASADDRHLLIGILEKIRDHFKKLEKTEYEFFGGEVLHLRNLKRDGDGKDQVLQVLADNDKDPVLTYQEAALGFCENAINELKRTGD